MTSRHGLSHVLRPTRPLTFFRRKSQPFHTSLRLHRDLENGVNDQPTPKAPSLLSEQIRACMRLTPHPLTTIVSYAKKAHAPKVAISKPCALLVSSFNTITLGPVPYVSFNIRIPSTTYSAILESDIFLASGVNSAKVAHAFVKNPHSSGKTQGWEDTLEEEVKGEGNGKVNENEKGKLKEGGVWWMQCQLIEKKCVHVGDHVIVVAKVLKAGTYGGENGLGLVYVDGKYREAGRIVDHGEERGV